MDIDHEMHRLAARQHGVVGRAQLHELGCSESAIRHRARNPAWQASGPRTLVLTGSPPTEMQTLMVAVLELAPNAVVSHESAARLWGLPGFRPRSPQVTVLRTRPRRSRPRLDIEVHWTTTMTDGLVTTVDQVPVFVPARVLLDLAATLHPKRVERALDAAWAMDILEIDDIVTVLDVVGRQGRNGTVLLRELMVERAGVVRPESGLEARFHQLIARSGQAPFERQVELTDDRGVIGRVDALDRSARLVVEIDSARFHSALTDRRADAERDRRLTASGYTVRRFTDLDVWHRGDWVADECRRERRGRRRLDRTG